MGGHFSVAHIHKAWYVACTSDELGKKPLARTILDRPVVLFRDHEGPRALVDRCAHRNVPLSLGWVDRGRLICGYHGWEYDGCGVCRKVPALAGPQEGKARRVESYPVVEQQGYVWVYLDPAEESPSVQPFEFPEHDNAEFTVVRYAATMEATLHATLENILDVPHTAFLHRGLFRGVSRNRVTAVVRRGPDRVEAEYVGEPRPTGIIGRILAPQGGTVMHFDRFMMPSIAQVEYAIGDKNHLFATSVLTPISDFETRMYSEVTFKTVIPPRVLKTAVMPIAKRIIGQDQEVLKKQTETVKRFGGEQFASTDVDVLGPHIWRLLKQAERGDAPNQEAYEERVDLIA